MATKRFKSNKLCVKQLIERFMESPHRSDMVMSDRSSPDDGVFRFHYEGKVSPILKDLLQPIEDPDFLDEFIPGDDQDKNDLHLAIHLETETLFEVMVWDYDKDYRIRHVCIHVNGKPDRHRLINFVPRRGE